MVLICYHKPSHFFASGNFHIDMIGYNYQFFGGCVWRSHPYGMSLLSPPCSFASSPLTSPAKLLSTRSGVLFVRWEDKFDLLKVRPLVACY